MAGEGRIRTDCTFPVAFSNLYRRGGSSFGGSEGQINH